MSEEKGKSWRTDFAQRITKNPGQKQVSPEQITGKKADPAKTKEEK